MSNRNNPSNFNEDGLLDETNENQTIVDFTYILILVIRYAPQRIPLSIPVIDQRTMNTQELTNERIDELIQRPLDLRGIATTIVHTMLLHLLILLLPHYWHLMMCILTIYAITSINTQPNETPNMVHSPVDALLGNTLNLYQDAEAQGRTAQPTDSDIEFSSTVEMLSLPQLSIEETQDHDLDAPTNLDNIRQTDPIPVNPSIEILQSLSDQLRRLHEIMADFNRIMNTFVALELQHNIDSSDSSEEEDSSLSSEDGHDGDDENDSLDDVQSQGRISPIPAVQLNPIQNHGQSNQTDLVVNSTTNTTDSNTSQNQAQDIDLNVHNPTDLTQRLILPPRLTCILVPKAHHRPQIHGESSDEHVS